MNIQLTHTRRRACFTVAHNRRGAVLPLFALLLPVMLILCGLAVNVAYLQLVSTEMKLATDAAAHAGGRAMSIEQTTEAAYEYVEQNAAANSVGGQPLGVILNEDFVQFGKSIRGDNGYGRYEFTQVARSSVDAGTEQATSISVLATMDIPLLFGAIPGVNQVPASRRSIATQVDRDIALVLDRSGSMLYYRDDDALSDALWDLYTTYETVLVPGEWRYSWYSGWYWVPPYYAYTRKISYSEYSNATQYLYYRSYSSNVINQLADISQEMSDFAYDWQYTSGAARYSRWYYLAMGVDAFLDVLDFTDQNELVSLVTFNSSARLDYSLQSNYDNIRSLVDGISPYGGTAVGDGMTTGLPPIVSGEAARPFAAKTIVVLTDGISNSGQDPVSAVEDIIEGHNVTIHTVTFTLGADQSAMEEVAEIGQGRHYHADDGSALVEIFEEIANNLPTILTE